MKNVIYHQQYNENFLEKVKREIFPIYHLWSVRPLENPKNVLIAGLCSDFWAFEKFIDSHANVSYPYDLIVHLANGEKNYPLIMLNTSKRYLIIRFPQNNTSGIGTPLYFQYK